MENHPRVDVIIAGTGIAGTTLGAICASEGLSVQLIEVGKHPRFALGEALLPQSAIWPFMIGEAFNIPEISHLSHADRIVDNITKSCGIKHSIGFVHHAAGQPHDGQRMHQLVPPHLPFYSESHLMREDIDLYLLQAAQTRGCHYIDECKIEDVHIDPAEGVRLATSRGTFEGAYYVDATGRNSVLADEMGYRAAGHDLATHSRSIFAHVEGLKPYDDLVDELPGLSRRLHDGTLHHVFDGGWMWVIPFDNFDRSTSTLASVGLMLDTRRFPVLENLSPEEEFHHIISAFPDVARHLGDVRAVRPFVRTGRLQYSAGQSVGDRHYITNNTFGFTDAIYSNGLINTFESVFFGAHALLDAFKRGARPEDFSAKRFASVERLHQEQLRQADWMASHAYMAMGDVATWSAWTQVWLAQVLFHDLWLQRACFQYFDSGDRSRFTEFLKEARPGVDAPFMAGKEELFAATGEALEAFAAGKRSAHDAANAIFASLRAQEWLPKHVYDWGNPEARHVDFTDMERVQNLFGWGFGEAPEAIRTGLFDFSLPG